MLVTIQVANKYKLANHYMDEQAVYVSSLKIDTISTKKGIATDTFKFVIEKEVFNSLGETFTYLCYDTPVKLYIDNVLVISGYVSKLNTTAKNQVTLDVASIASWQMTQFLSPAIASSCQNQTYSENCTLDKDIHKFEFSTVDIDCFTGSIDIGVSGNEITLGGNVSSNGNSLFLNLSNWWNAIVIINDIYRTTVVNVSDNKIFLGLNYLDMAVTTVSLVVYLKCDKTYGECYSRFNNTKNFWGFANNGNQVQTFDIFSASSLEFCGDELQEQTYIECDSDFNLFGVNFGAEEDNGG